jgi:CRP-like cAMP-binding protein
MDSIVNTISSQTASSLPRYVEKNQLLSQLIAAGPDFLKSRLHFVHLSANETIYNEGDRVNYAYFPLDSVVSSMAMLRDGATVEIAMFGNESLIGLSTIFGPRTNQYWTRMCLGGRLAKLDVEDLIVAFSESKQVAKIVLQSYTSLVTHISQRSVCHAKHSVMERFCCWLLMIQDRVPDGSIRLTQELVASRLGTRRAGITVAARMLFDEKALEYRRGMLRIKDREALEQHACECYSLLSVKSEHVTQPLPAPQAVRGVVLPINPLRRFVPGRISGV